MSDQKLYQLCQQYGSTALQARRKFLGLLPEVAKRQLWKAKNFHSIYEFAAKLAGVSENQVNEVLRLERKLFDKPVLHKQLIQGQVSHNKLARIVTLATSTNQEIWANRVETLSKSALDTLVKDEKTLDKAMSGQTFSPHLEAEANITLKTSTIERLNILKNQGFDIDQLINEMLDQREQQIANEKEQIAAITKPSTSRHISIKIRRLLQKEYGQKCSIPHCPKPATIIHHTQRFALTQNHNPHYLAPLCHQHHEIAHKIDQKFSSHADSTRAKISRH
jgi:hypothetical protein